MTLPFVRQVLYGQSRNGDDDDIYTEGIDRDLTVDQKTFLHTFRHYAAYIIEFLSIHWEDKRAAIEVLLRKLTPELKEIDLLDPDCLDKVQFYPYSRRELCDHMEEWVDCLNKVTARVRLFHGTDEQEGQLRIRRVSYDGEETLDLIKTGSEVTIDANPINGVVKEVVMQFTQGNYDLTVDLKRLVQRSVVGTAYVLTLTGSDYIRTPTVERVLESPLWPVAEESLMPPFYRNARDSLRKVDVSHTSFDNLQPPLLSSAIVSLTWSGPAASGRRH